jgi:broad specificity phosphatase PhoE
MRERCFGAWELRPWTEVLLRLKQGHPPPGGETESAFIERTMAGLQTVRSARTGLPVVVAHGGTFHALARANGREVREIRNLD